MLLRFLSSGESHGKCLNAIIEGVPAGITIDVNFINNELARRQIGYGRGGRMLIEKDKVKILSGVRHGKSIGSPICLEIENKDWENWLIPMSSGMRFWQICWVMNMRIGILALVTAEQMMPPVMGCGFTRPNKTKLYLYATE